MQFRFFTAHVPLMSRSVTAQLPLDYRSITARVPFQTVFPVIISIMDKAKQSKKDKSETSAWVSFLFFQKKNNEGRYYENRIL